MGLPSNAAITAIWAGAVSRWKMDEASGANAADSLGSNMLTQSGTVGTLAGGGPFGDDCRDFESGSSQRFSITDAAQTGLDFTGDFSFTWWIKPESAPLQAGIFGKWTGVGNHRSYGLCFDSDGVARWQCNNSSAGTAGSSATSTLNGAYTTGLWQWLVFVYTAAGGTFDIYVGSVDGSGVAHVGQGSGLATSIFNGTASFEIGRNQAIGTSALYDGAGQDAIIGSGALSSDDVTAMYNLHFPSGRPLINAGLVNRGLINAGLVN